MADGRKRSMVDTEVGTEVRTEVGTDDRTDAREMRMLPPAEDFQSGKYRTQFASEAVDLAEVFRLLIGTTPLRGPTQFHVELSAPDGPSTGGGVQSVQHIKLVATDGGGTLVAGWADQAAATAELRTLDYLDAQHDRRFRGSSLKAPPRPSERLDRKQYLRLLERLRSFFDERELLVSVVDLPEPRTVTRLSAPESATPTARAPSLLLGAILGLAMAAVAYLISR
jgi:hypothetical protein